MSIKPGTSTYVSVNTLSANRSLLIDQNLTDAITVSGTLDVNASALNVIYDSSLCSNGHIGLDFTYIAAKLDVDGVSQTNDIDIFSSTIYGDYSIINDKTTLYYQLGYSMQKTAVAIMILL